MSLVSIYTLDRVMLVLCYVSIVLHTSFRNASINSFFFFFFTNLCIMLSMFCCSYISNIDEIGLRGSTESSFTGHLYVVLAYCGLNVYSLLSSYYPRGILMEEFQMQFVA